MIYTRHNEMFILSRVAQYLQVNLSLHLRWTVSSHIICHRASGETTIKLNTSYHETLSGTDIIYKHINYAGQKKI